ncbi:hypothetical protein [Limosilactobacillus ingluviei]|uniref:hypothetical protein n=1 Tax=Limosilactobacillus ingluviei TaxID=148604 RepID=UPI00265FADA3|nr:hypothetical protein [Limosilactobacillus ingluviei]
MGSRGASSGVAKNGKKYGTEYRTLLQYGNIKFIRHNSPVSNPPMETMSKGRIYVVVNKEGKLKNIVHFDNNNLRSFQIDLDHAHKIDGIPTKPHVHLGYYHNEKGDRKITKQEERLIELVKKIWDNNNGK